MTRQLDASVGQQLRVAICRGGAALDVDLPVDDLHALTPARMLPTTRTVTRAVARAVAVGLTRFESDSPCSDPRATGFFEFGGAVINELSYQQ
eukprot:2877383-Prymnesium_polylepis.1